VWAFNHTGKSITVFGARDGQVIATIPLSGELEEAVEDATARRMFVNIEDKGAIGVIDTSTHAVVAEWPMPGCEGPTGMAFDEKNHLILSACDGKMAVVDSRSGKMVTSFPIADAVDGNGFDAATGYAFASSRTGVLTIAHEDAPGVFSVVQTLKTQPVRPHDDARSRVTQRLCPGRDDHSRSEWPRADRAEYDEGSRLRDDRPRKALSGEATVNMSALFRAQTRNKDWLHVPAA
jgi:hypothetical protein